MFTPTRPPVSAPTTTDDVAIWVDDTVEPSVAMRCGASPAALVALSPAKASSAAEGATHGGGLRMATPSSAGRKTPLVRLHFADVTNTPCRTISVAGAKTPTPREPSGTPPLMPPPRSAALFQDPQPTSTPTTHHITGSSSVSKGGVTSTTPSVVIHASSKTAPSPLPTVPREEHDRLQRAYERLQRMYKHKGHQAEEAEAARASAQQLLDAKITEVITLSSRLDENKRFTKQLKGELKEAKHRALPFHNAPFTDTARVERKFQGLLQQTEDHYQRMLDDECRRSQELEEVLDERCDGSLTHREALLRSFRLRQELQAQLEATITEKDKAESRMLDQIRGFEEDVARIKRAQAAEHQRYIQQSEYLQQLEALVVEQQRELDDLRGGVCGLPPPDVNPRSDPSPQPHRRGSVGWEDTSIYSIAPTSHHQHHGGAGEPPIVDGHVVSDFVEVEEEEDEVEEETHENEAAAAAEVVSSNDTISAEEDSELDSLGPSSRSSSIAATPLP